MLKGKNGGKYSDELFTSICDRIATSKDSLKTICKEAGVSYTAFKNWLNNDEEAGEENNKGLVAQYARAKRNQADYFAELIVDVAFEDEDDEKPFVGANHIQRDRLKIDALKWAASKSAPKKYGEKVDVTSDGEKLQSVDVAGVVKSFMTNEGND